MVACARLPAAQSAAQSAARPAARPAAQPDCVPRVTADPLVRSLPARGCPTADRGPPRAVTSGTRLPQSPPVIASRCRSSTDDPERTSPHAGSTRRPETEWRRAWRPWESRSAESHRRSSLPIVPPSHASTCPAARRGLDRSGVATGISSHGGRRHHCWHRLPRSPAPRRWFGGLERRDRDRRGRRLVSRMALRQRLVAILYCHALSEERPMRLPAHTASQVLQTYCSTLDDGTESLDEERLAASLASGPQLQRSAIAGHLVRAERLMAASAAPPIRAPMATGSGPGWRSCGPREPMATRYAAMSRPSATM